MYHYLGSTSGFWFQEMALGSRFQVLVDVVLVNMMQSNEYINTQGEGIEDFFSFHYGTGLAEVPPPHQAASWTNLPID
jgi:hypothetical protein